MIGTVSITAISLFAMASSNAIINILNAAQSEEDNNDEQVGLWTTSELGIPSDPTAPPSYALAMNSAPPHLSPRSVVISTGDEPAPPGYEEATRSDRRKKRASWIRARLQEYHIIMSD